MEAVRMRVTVVSYAVDCWQGQCLKVVTKQKVASLFLWHNAWRGLLVQDVSSHSPFAAEIITQFSTPAPLGSPSLQLKYESSWPVVSDTKTPSCASSVPSMKYTPPKSSGILQNIRLLQCALWKGHLPLPLDFHIGIFAKRRRTMGVGSGRKLGEFISRRLQPKVHKIELKPGIVINTNHRRWFNGLRYPALFPYFQRQSFQRYEAKLCIQILWPALPFENKNFDLDLISRSQIGG